MKTNCLTPNQNRIINGLIRLIRLTGRVGSRIAAALVILHAWSALSYAATDGTASVDMSKQRNRTATPSNVQKKNEPEGQQMLFGISRAEWTQRFWARSLSIPLAVAPANDLTGVQCGINQAGPVWFLAAPLGTSNQLSCTIPAGKVILAPPAAFFNDYPCPDPTFQPAPGQTLEDFLTLGVRPIIDSFTVAVELDGRPVKVQRITAPLQSFIGAADIAPTLDPCVTGSPQLAVADGLYSFIGPLSPGLHILHFHAESTQFPTTDNVFRLTIK